MRPIISFKTAWTKVPEKAGVKGRWHDNRHTLVTGLAGVGRRGRGDHEHRRARLTRHALRYSQLRMEAKRRALDEIAARQRAADEKRQVELERLQQAAVASPPVVVQ